METPIRNWSPTNQTAKKSSSSRTNDDCSGKLQNNSWDCSTPTDKCENSKRKTNDWDSSSECQETMVEPFDGNDVPKNWDSDNEVKPPLFLPSSLDSFDLTNSEKTSTGELLGSEEGKHHEEDLLVEDFEEYTKEESEQVRSNQSEGTREDTTIWMIPKSQRTQSGDSTSSSSDKVFKFLLKKAKSLSDMEKPKRRTSRSYRSEVVGTQKKITNIPPCEGFDIKGKLDLETKNSKSSFHRTRVFFTEYECRAMTVEKDTPSSRSHCSGRESTTPETIAENEEAVEPGPSGQPSDVKEGEEPKQDGQNLMSESWLLLDNTGQCRTISRNEVSVFFDGRSAEAVLENRAEHLIPTAALRDTSSLKNTLGNMMAKESLAQVLKQDDIGGEDERKRLISLERKVENTLLYIQPGMNLTASIRIIPVDTEMIHIWRRTKDPGSVLSSEMDLHDPSQDSVETGASKVFEQPTTNLDRTFVADTVTEEKDNRSVGGASTNDEPADVVAAELPTSQPPDYSRLLLETRMIVDSLTNHFKLLQNRLDGETSRNVALQGEVNKLRLIMKSSKESQQRDTEVEDGLTGDAATSPFLLTPKVSDNTEKIPSGNDIVVEESNDKTSIPEDLKVQDESTSTRSLKCSADRTIAVQSKEVPVDNDVITVNIFTMENPTPVISCTESQDNTYSVIQSNLRLIETKMKRLQQENEVFMRQNVELKRKLKEISQELEKYLAGTSEQETWVEETPELETLRDQVCNLKLELENFKTLLRIQEEQLTEENSLIREELTVSLFSLQEWYTIANEVYKAIKTSCETLQGSGITIDINLESESWTQEPKNLLNSITHYLNQIIQLVRTKETLEIPGLDQVISGYSDLIDQCRKGQITGETKARVMEDYFTVIMEKASLMEEIKILKTENEMLLESQLEHYEKLKQTMIALKDRKTEITALESSQKLSEEERNKMAEVIKLYEEERQRGETELKEKNKIIEDFLEKEIDWKEKLNTVVSEVKNLEKCCRLKEEMINELKMKNEELLSEEKRKNEQIEAFKSEIARLEIQESQLVGELNSTKLFLTEAQKEMTAYITHLEALVNTSQESLDKTKQKLKETNQALSRLKSDNEILEKQHQCDVKLFNSTKDELESWRDKHQRTTNKLRECEEDREKLQKDLEATARKARDTTEALEVLTKQHKVVLEENEELKKKVEVLSEDKDDLLSEQKELIGKYAHLSKEIQKIQEKYRTVKMECNERTDLIRYLEQMLKENLLEYTNRIACLEQNISRIIEKILACKNEMKEKRLEDDTEVRELRHQLNVTYQERKELENVVNNYYSLMKHMEEEIQEREKVVDELHDKLERQKTVDFENETSPVIIPSRVEELEEQITKTEGELEECRKELQRSLNEHENEKKKLELTIADLRSEIKRYQLRIEVMMRNLSNCNKNINGLIADKRNVESSEIQEKNKEISELNSSMNSYRREMKQKESELENLRKKIFYLEEELKNKENEISRLEGKNRTMENFQKEKEEMAEKLFQSIKLLMEERSARQTVESLAVEKENNYRNQVEQVKSQLLSKMKEFETTTSAFEEKKRLVTKLEEEIKRMKMEVATLKQQVNSYRRQSRRGEEQNSSMSGTNVSPERLESCLKELKEVRDVNLELRKTEGQYQAKIVRLEDEIRDARLLIKELQGDIKTEKKSKKAYKNMILAARMEIEKFVLNKQLMSVVAERITRHLNLKEIPSRELLSGFRVSDLSSNSSR